MSEKKRRGNGEGSYVKLPSGKWQYRRSILTPAGTYKTFSGTAKTQHEAREKAEKRIAEYTQQASDMTVEEFSKEYIKVGCAEGLMKKTTVEKTIRPTFKNRINPVLGDKKLVDLKRPDIQQWVNELVQSNCLRRNQRLSKKGVESILGVLKASLTWAVDMDYIDHNPAMRIRVPDLTSEDEATAKRDKKKEDFLSEDELTQFMVEIATPNKYPTKNVMMFMVYTGCRPSEALGLTWKCVEKSRERVRIEKTLEKIPGQGPYLDSTKTSHTRDIWLTGSIADIIQEQEELQRSYRKAFGLEWKPELDLVFTQPDGKPFTEKMLYGQVKKAGKAIGLKNSKGEERELHPHSLRHTFVTLMINSGKMTLTEVSQYVGHTNIGTTKNFYCLGDKQDREYTKRSTDYIDSLLDRKARTKHAETV